MEILDFETGYKKLMARISGKRYAAMYSTLIGAIVTDQRLMVLPLDDHMVHRGDGVFEAIRFYGKHVFLCDAHLERLRTSCGLIGLSVPKSLSEIKSILLQIVEVANLPEGILRIFVSRGYGDFSTNPYSTQGSEIYIVATSFVPVSPAKYQSGVSVDWSNVPVKPGLFANVKSCNYLPNVLMKKESLDRKVDFTIGVTAEGFVTEGPTENIALLTRKNEFFVPDFRHTLRGTTILLAMEIAKRTPGIALVRECLLTKRDFETAKEIMMIGTTLGVLPVTTMAGRPVGDGGAGKVATQLNVDLEKKIRGEEV
jgi:4-amino-4-deoxychorismate lyase